MTVCYDVCTAVAWQHVDIGTGQRCTAEKYEVGSTCCCQVSNDFFLSNTTPADVSNRAGFVCLVILVVLPVGMLKLVLDSAYILLR